MFAVAAKQGDAETQISNLIGRHPEDGLIVILDEGTDINPGIITAIPNWEKGIEFFQLFVIGNSKSRNDLHGALATPLNGWDSIDPMRDKMWPTTHRNGICLYFNPYDSPAIKDPDPEKRKRLAKFLVTKESIEHDKAQYGEDSDAFWRFVMGFWKSTTIDSTIVSEQFLTERQVRATAEWSGYMPLAVVAGLDPAFAVGGVGCKLRVGVLGQTTDGLVVLDFRKEELLFTIDIEVTNSTSGEQQLAEKVAQILRAHAIGLGSVAIDATGAGRALGSLIKLVMNSDEEPFRIVSGHRGFGIGQKKNDPMITTATPSEMWSKFQEFIQHGQIKGLDEVTARQFVTRLVTVKNGKRILETKDEYKARMTAIDPKLARSPDEADATVLCLFAAILRHGFRPGERKPLPSRAEDFWNQKIWVFTQGQQGLLDRAKPVEQRRPELLPNFSSGIEDSVPYKSRREEY